MPTPHINNLREHLLETLSALRDRENPMEPDRARAIASVASVLVDSAKVEVDYLRVTQQDSAPFMEAAHDTAQVGGPEGGPILSGMTGVKVHRLRG